MLLRSTQGFCRQRRFAQVLRDARNDGLRRRLSLLDQGYHSGDRSTTGGIAFRFAHRIQGFTPQPGQRCLVIRPDQPRKCES